MTKLKKVTRIAYRKDPEPGEKGERGAVPRLRKFVTGVEYQCGAAGEKFLDYAYYDGVWYKCLITHTPTGNANPFDDIGHDIYRWEVESSFSFLATECAIVGSDGNGWILSEGEITHTSGKVTLNSDGSANFNDKCVITAEGRITAKDGYFYGSFATPAKGLDNTTNAVTLDFSTGFNYSGIPVGVKTINLPTSTAYDGVECTITNLEYNESKYFNIQCSDGTAFLYSGKYSTARSITKIHLYGCGTAILKAIKVSSTSVRWFLINHSDFAYDYSKSAITNKVVSPNMRCVGAYTINSGSSLSTILCSDGNSLSMTKVADGQWKLTFAKTRLKANYMIVNAENTTAGIVTAINLSTTGFNIVCGAFFELANQWYYYNPNTIKFFIIEYDI